MCSVFSQSLCRSVCAWASRIAGADRGRWLGPGMTSIKHETKPNGGNPSHHLFLMIMILWWDVPANQPSSELGVILMDQPPYHRGRGCPNDFVLDAMVTTGNPSCDHLSQPCSCSHRPPFPRRDGLEKPAGCWSMLESLKRTRDKLVFVRDISGI